MKNPDIENRLLGCLAKCSVKNPPESGMAGYTQEVMTAIESSVQPAKNPAWTSLSLPSFRVGLGFGTVLAGLLLLVLVNHSSSQRLLDQDMLLLSQMPEGIAVNGSEADLLDQIREIDHFIVAKTLEQQSPAPEEPDLLEELHQLDEAQFAFS